MQDGDSSGISETDETSQRTRRGGDGSIAHPAERVRLERKSAALTPSTMGSRHKILYTFLSLNKSIIILIDLFANILLL